MAALSNNITSDRNLTHYCKFQEDFKYILLPVSYALVFVVGLALNAMALFVILFRTKRWKPSTIYMLNLTTCDTLYILTLPFLIYYYADENDWPFSEPLCKIIRFLFYANLYGKPQLRKKSEFNESEFSMVSLSHCPSGQQAPSSFCAASVCIASLASATLFAPSTGSVLAGPSSCLWQSGPLSSSASLLSFTSQEPGDSTES